MLPRVASEDIINLGNDRYAHFRRHHCFAQVQVTFTAPEGIDPNPGRELTDQLKELGWTWREKEPGKPWTHQLEKASEDDPTAPGDSRDVLHEQFLIVIQEYRQKHGMPPTGAWLSLAESNTKGRSPDGQALSGGSAADQAATMSEEQKPKSEEEETRAGEPALVMLEAFASVGAPACDITWINATGEKVAFRGNRPLDHVRSSVPTILRDAAARQHNVIVRPRPAGPALIQLDDLHQSAAEKLRPVSFLVLCTSPGSYQCWLAVADADNDFTRRLRKGTGADLSASGAARLAGSFNFKEKYAPAFPRVEPVHVSPGNVVTRARLEALGVVAPPEKAAQAVPRRSRLSGARGWPNYQRCVENAPPARGENRPDISRADFTFCLLAIDWGWGVEETAARLLKESAKAQANGEAYALRTAQNAAAALQRRGRPQRG